MNFPKQCKRPMSTNYCPETDVSPCLSTEDASYFQLLIGVLHWMVDLGRVDICCEVSMLALHLAMPREGHLWEAFYICGYLKARHNTEMVFLQSLQYKLQMMGIPCVGPMYVYGDNKLVLYNTLLPESTLKKSPKALPTTLYRKRLRGMSGEQHMSIHTRILPTS